MLLGAITPFVSSLGISGLFFLLCFQEDQVDHDSFPLGNKIFSYSILLMDDILELAEVQNQLLTREVQRLQSQNVNRSTEAHAGLGLTTLSNNSLKD